MTFQNNEMAVSGRKGASAMADSISQSSMEDYDISCQPCSFEGNNVGAEGYCQTCSEYLCKTCLSVHRKQSATRNHIITGNDKMLNAQSKNKNNCTKCCAVHCQEKVKFYCKSHDVVGCGDCMVSDHKTCKVDFVTEVTHMIDDEQSAVRQQIIMFQKELEGTKQLIQSSKRDIAENNLHIRKEIKTFREEIDKRLDDMEVKLVSELDEVRRQADVLVVEMSNELQGLESDLKHLFSEIESISDERSDLFVSLKQAEAKMRYLKLSHRHIHSKHNVRLFEFEKNNDICKLLCDDAVFGMLKVRKHEPTPHTRRNVLEMKASDVEKNKTVDKTESDGLPISGILTSVLTAEELVVADSQQTKMNEAVNSVSKEKNRVIEEMKIKEREVLEDIKKYKEQIEMLRDEKSKAEVIKERAVSLLKDKEANQLQLESELGLAQQQVKQYKEQLRSLDSDSIDPSIIKSSHSVVKISDPEEPAPHQRIKDLENVVKMKDEELSKMQQKVMELSMIASTRSSVQDKVSITSCYVGDLVLLCLDELLDQYVVFTVSTTLHFLHTDCLSPLGLKSETCESTKQWMIAEVIDKEYCQAKKSNNRFKVPVGTKFYRVRAKHWTRENAQSPVKKLDTASGSS